MKVRNHETISQFSNLFHLHASRCWNLRPWCWSQFLNSHFLLFFFINSTFLLHVEFGARCCALGTFSVYRYSSFFDLPVPNPPPVDHKFFRVLSQRLVYNILSTKLNIDSRADATGMHRQRIILCFKRYIIAFLGTFCCMLSFCVFLCICWHFLFVQIQLL